MEHPSFADIGQAEYSAKGAVRQKARAGHALRRLPFTDQVKAMPGVTVLPVRREDQEALLAHILWRQESS